MSTCKTSHTEPHAQRKCILLAEDHPLNQKVAYLLLERMGYDVNVVGDGLQAVQAVGQHAYDAILMDCQMPKMDGFEASRAIRHQESDTGLHIPIIAVTALAMVGDRERCLAAGMDDYLTKPIDRDRLRDKLVFWTNSHRLASACHANNVVQIFDDAFTITETDELPLQFDRFVNAYGEEAYGLFRLFISSSDNLIADLGTAVHSDDYRTAARIAHELKGASWAIGADEMARLSLFVEQAAGQESFQMVRRTFIRLTHHFSEVKALLYSRLAASECAQVST